jgi:hypothetical protein
LGAVHPNITTIGSIDSGFATYVAPRNDGGEHSTG